MTICIRPHDIGKDSANVLGQKIHELGFDGVQLAIAKAIVGQNGNPETLSKDVVKEIHDGFTQNNVQIPVLGAYFNPVHSNKEKVAAGQAKFADHLQKASLFGAKFVASETGSYNDEPWTYNPKNQTEEAFEEVKKVFTPLAKTAKEFNSFVSMEGAWHHCMYCPKQMKRMLDFLNSSELGDGHVWTTVDILNYLYIGNYETREKILDECLDLFKGKVGIFHMKDFVVSNEELVEVPLGDGIMGWNKFLPKIAEAVPNANLIFEGVPEPAKSLKFVKDVLKSI